MREGTRRDGGFERCHPLVPFLYFLMMILLTAVLFYPPVLLASLAGAAVYAAVLRGVRGLKMTFQTVLVITALTVLMNGLTVHQGNTVLGTFFGQPLTAEAFRYGLSSGFMLSAVLLWFYDASFIMTSDRLIAVFGRVFPRTSLVFSMSLRYLPRLTAEGRTIREARHAAEGVRKRGSEGREGAESEGRTRNGAGGKAARRSKVRDGFRDFSVLTSWSLEHSIVTSDSMRARGYGLPGRTFYTRFRFCGRDLAGVLVIAGLASFLFTGYAVGWFLYYCYPQVTAAPLAGWTRAGWLVFILAAFLPTLACGEETLRWRFFRSKI